MTEDIRARERELAEAEQTATSKKPWLEVDADLIEEKREIASMITLLKERRSELDLYLEFVDDLNDEDTDRIEEIYEELARNEDGRMSEDDDAFPGGFFTPRRSSAELTARRGEDTKKAAAGEKARVGKAQLETSEEASDRSESISGEDDMAGTGKGEHGVYERSADVRNTEADATEVESTSISLLTPAPAVDAAFPAEEVIANHESASERRASAGRAMRRPPAAPSAPLEKPESEPVSLIQKQRAIFESADVKSEPRSFVQKQRSLSFDRRKKKAAAQAAADGAENAAVIKNEAAGAPAEPMSLIQKQRALFEAADVKAEPRSFVQKQRSLSFDRRKKKAAAQAAADGAENAGANNEAAGAPAEPMSLIQKQSALFESQDAKPVPERLQKQRSLSFDRRKKKAAAQAAVDDATIHTGHSLVCDAGDSAEMAAHTKPGGQHEAATAYFGVHTGPLTLRVLVTGLCAAGTDKSTLMRQRLVRARSSGKLGAAAAPTPEPLANEVGIKVWPI